MKDTLILIQKDILRNPLSFLSFSKRFFVLVAILRKGG